MVLELVHLILLTATLLCGLVVAWYAHKIHAAQARELSFLDARDVEQRRHRAEARHAVQAWNKELDNWHRDTRAILGKLYAIAAETSAEERDTRLMPPPTQPPSLPLPASSTAAPDTSPQPGVAPVSRQRPSPRASTPTAYRAVSPPASAPLLSSAPACVAAGIGPRPPASTSIAPAKAEARFPATLLSMPATAAPGSPRASRSARPIAPIPPIATRSICHECDGGFIAVGNGGIGKCRGCEGSGFVDAR
jgi:hypothetical protein